MTCTIWQPSLALQNIKSFYGMYFEKATFPGPFSISAFGSDEECVVLPWNNQNSGGLWEQLLVQDLGLADPEGTSVGSSVPLVGTRYCTRSIPRDVTFLGTEWTGKIRPLRFYLTRFGWTALWWCRCSCPRILNKQRHWAELSGRRWIGNIKSMSHSAKLEARM